MTQKNQSQRWLLIEIYKNNKQPTGRWQNHVGQPPRKDSTGSSKTEWIIIDMKPDEVARDVFKEFVGMTHGNTPYWKRGHDLFNLED